MTPHTALFALCHRVAGWGLGREPLTQDGQSRTELVCSDIRTTHAALSCEGRAAVKYTVVINCCTSGSANAISTPNGKKGCQKELERSRENARCEKVRTNDSSRRKLYPILRVLRGDQFVPRTHSLVQKRDVLVCTSRSALLSSLFHRTARKFPAAYVQHGT
jgi:hypothetical protein